MNEKELKKLREGATADIVAQLGDIAPADIKALVALELADKEPRQDLVNSANAYLVERLEAETVQANERAELAGKEADDATAKAESAEKKLANAVESGEVVVKEPEPEAEPPEWQAPGYTGALTGEQAQWRNKHLTKDRIEGKQDK